MRTIVTLGLLLNLACCARMQVTQTGTTIRYEERRYAGTGRLHIEEVAGVLRQEPLCSGTIVLKSRELRLLAHERQPWGLPKEPTRLAHASDLWRLRKKHVGYLNLFLIRHDADGNFARIVRRQLGEDGEMHGSKPDLLNHARPGDLILGMRGI